MEFLVENATPELSEYLTDFCTHVCSELGLPTHPDMTFVDKTNNTSFGSYRPVDGSIIVATGGRHVADILRTLAHEIVHDVQHLNGEPDLPLDELEYEANAMAGMLMRDWNKLHPELYGVETANPAHASEQEYESQGAVFPDVTRPSGPINMGEEMAGGVVNSAGSGAIAGLGVGPQGEPGIHPKKKKTPILQPMARRKTFAALREAFKDPALEARKKLAPQSIPVDAKALLARRKLIAQIDARKKGNLP